MRWMAGGIGAVLALGIGMAAAQTPRQLEALRDDVAEIEEDLARVRAQIGGGGTAASASDLLIRLDRIETELRVVTGKLEELGFEQRRVAQDAARRFGDIEFRLTELEGGDPTSLPPALPLGTDTAAGPDVSVSEREDLDRAIADVEQGRFDQGEERLARFLSVYPGSPLQPEAQFWLGESQFTRGAYQAAARSFLDGYNLDRAGATAARNLMRLGVTLGRLGQVAEACLTLREVRSQFPDAPGDVTEAADREADDLACG